MSAAEIQAILSIVASHPQGVGVTDIQVALTQRFGVSLHRRTLQRRLHRLVREQRLSTQGDSVALVYCPVGQGAVPSISAWHAALGASTPLVLKETTEAPYITVSPDGQTIRDHVNLPLMRRRPVGYQRQFLDQYQPGVTFYLPEPLRQQLHAIGRTPADQRPAGTYARDILGRLLVDLSWASSQLEGNTYSRLDTQNLIEFGQVAQGKDAFETQMILNHKAAIEMLVESADDIGFDAFTFQNLHAVLSQDLLSDPDACGRLRNRPVEISGTVFHPLTFPQVLADCFHVLLAKAAAIPDPFEQAFFLMVQLPYLQPFDDVNKRVSRLGANISLIRHNLCPLSFIDVPDRAYIDGTLGVYELNQVALLRDVFVWAYERSCQRYLAVTQEMVAPDPVKIRYREALIRAVQDVVRGVQEPVAPLLESLAVRYADAADRAIFVGLLGEALRHLHEGSVARYRLRRAEYLAWRQRK
ncbi:Fic family protein [Castellaniella caeni]|uniref:Fic family protein n=1 Tax=Castellaniella caeni TaxID=266123 RepID=UPI0008337015|nr:Fic family protein [Castellaniella caeni]